MCEVKSGQVTKVLYYAMLYLLPPYLLHNFCIYLHHLFKLHLRLCRKLLADCLGWELSVVPNVKSSWLSEPYLPSPLKVCIGGQVKWLSEKNRSHFFCHLPLEIIMLRDVILQSCSKKDAASKHWQTSASFTSCVLHSFRSKNLILY